VEGDGHHPVGVILVDEARRASVPAHERDRAVEHGLIDELGVRLLRHERVHAGHGRDELRLEVDAGG
jgi:hypothetical protein